MKILFFSSEIFLISFYLVLLFLSITIQPLILIFGLICNLFLPGYNLTLLIKPNSNLIQKIGYSTLLSIAFENVIMFFNYLLFYNYTLSNGNSSNGFQFKTFSLIITFQIITLIMVLFNIVRYYRFKNSRESQSKIALYELLKQNIRKIRLRSFIIFIGFILSLVLLCFSVYFSDVDPVNFEVHYEDYRDNFTFFKRVPYFFFIFLGITIVLLVISIFYNNNKFLNLICFSLFLYCLWILPYLQIKNYFSNDSYFLYRIYTTYLESGIVSYREWGFSILPDFGALRYSTNLFTSIVLTSGTNTNINFSLWFLYPIIYIFIPFLFYSVYERYSTDKSNKKIGLILLVTITILTPQILKSGHNVSTGLLGIFIFLILIVEFYEFLNENSNLLKLLDLGLIILLYFFLCLTHLEECIYFLILLVFYCFYLVFINTKRSYPEINKEHSKFISGEINNILLRGTNTFRRKSNIKHHVRIITLLIGILTFIFYLTLEFFGHFNYYVSNIIRNETYMEKILEVYQYTTIRIPIILGNTISINILIVLIIFIGIVLFYIFNSLILKYNLFFTKILSKTFLLFRKVYKFFKKIINTKTFYIMFFLIILGFIIYSDLFILGKIESNLLILITILSLLYSTSIFYLFLFLKSFNYYNIHENKLIYYFFAIISCSSIVLILLLIGNFWLAIYVLHTKFLIYLAILNLIIIQNNYFDQIFRWKKFYLVFLIIIFFILGVFYSLRSLRYG